MDISHPQSPAVSRGEAELKDGGDDPTSSVRRIRPTCQASLRDQSVKNLSAMQETWVRFLGHEFDLWVRKIPWRRKWQSTPVILPGESNEQKSLDGYSPWGGKELDTI